MKEVDNMTYKQIEASREARLWIGQVIAPAAAIVAVILAKHPEYREAIAKKFEKIKNTIGRKHKKL